MISERVKQLIRQARIVSFEAWQGQYSQEMIQIFQVADDQGRYLTDEDLERIGNFYPQLVGSLEKARLLREKAAVIVEEARQQVLENYPQITVPGGELYPPERAEACWRDFWHFLRCITYGIAGNSGEFLSQEGLKNMELLYQELGVPLPAMICGLENLKTFALQNFSAGEQSSLAVYFESLIEALRKFKP